MRPTTDSCFHTPEATSSSAPAARLAPIACRSAASTDARLWRISGSEVDGARDPLPRQCGKWLPRSSARALPPPSGGLVDARSVVLVRLVRTWDGTFRGAVCHALTE